jgi:hypothetical protein
MAQYGLIHQLTDFIERAIPKRGEGKYRDLFVHAAIGFVKNLGEAQEKNPWITIAAQAGGCILAYYRGQSLFQMKPARNHLRMIIAVKCYNKILTSCHQTQFFLRLSLQIT